MSDIESQLQSGKLNNLNPSESDDYVMLWEKREL